MSSRVLVLIALVTEALMSCAGSVTAIQGNLQVVARPAEVSAGQTVHFTITVTGPATYSRGVCLHTVQLWAAGPTDRIPINPQTGIQCLSLLRREVPTGTSDSFDVYWRTTGVPPGRYVVHGFLRGYEAGAPDISSNQDNLPAVRVDVNSA